MKTKHLLPLLLAGLLATTLWMGCKNEDPLDPNDEPPQPETSITFTCKDSVGLPDIFVGIAFESSDCDGGNFLRSGSTDAFGKVKFSNLASGTYCYEARRTAVGGVVKRAGTVELDQDEEAKVVVPF